MAVIVRCSWKPGRMKYLFLVLTFKKGHKVLLVEFLICRKSANLNNLFNSSNIPAKAYAAARAM